MVPVTSHRSVPHHADDQPETSEPPGVRRRRPRRWWALGLVAAVAATVWLAPMLAARPPVLRWIVATAAGRPKSEITVASASLGWLSPPVVTGVEVRDPDGQLVLAVSRATADRSLADLLWNWRDLGTIHVDKPTLNLVLRDDGSNLEDVLADLLPERDDESKSTRVGLRLEVSDGVVSISHPNTQKSWQIGEFQLALNLPATASEPLEAKTSGIVGNGQPSGRFAGELKVQRGSPDNSATGVPQAHEVSTAAPPAADAAQVGELPGLPNGEAKLQIENLPLEMCAPLLARFAPGSVTTAEGRLSATLESRFYADSKLESLSLDGTATVESLAIAAPVLGTDRPSLARIETECRIDYRDNRLTIHRLAARTDVGDVAVDGTLEFADADDLLAWLPRQTLDVEGQADLARLARLLPATLHIRDQVEILSGRFQIAAHCGKGGEGDSPIFAGTKIGTVPAKIGTVPAAAQWNGRIEVSNLTAVAGGRRFAWQEPIRLTLAAHEEPAGPVVDTIKCESDFLKLSASGTLDKITAQAAFDLDRLATQLGQFVDFGGLRLAGDGSAWLTWNRASDHRFQAQGKADLKDFQFASPEKHGWAEPKLAATFSASGQTDFASSHRLDAATVEVSAGDEAPDVIRATLTEPVAEFTHETAWPVEIHARGKLARWPARLAAWVNLAKWQLSGDYDVTARGTCSADVIDATLDATVGELVVANKSGRRIQEKQVRLHGRGRYQTGAKLLTLDEASLACAEASAAATCRVDGSSVDKTQLTIDGRVDYDLDKLSALARPYWGDGLYLNGRGTSPVSFRGAFSRDKTANPWAGAQGGTKLNWAWGDVYGFQLGPGEVQLLLADGVARVVPATLPVSEGKLNLAAQLRLDPAPGELTLPRGPLVENVRINPRMCANGLQYIAPVLAGVATAEGRFSIELDGCRIPLADPKNGELAGRMIIHSAQIGPGPLVRELALALGYNSPAQLANNSAIDFRMVDGRVYHRGVVVELPDLTIRTHGWVGLDKTMALMAEMPVPPKWLGNNLVGTALKDQTISLPIGGTLDHPKVDQKALGEASQKFLQNAATGVIEDQLRRGLEQLFQPRR